jgi:hypothetical protein
MNKKVLVNNKPLIRPLATFSPLGRGEGKLARNCASFSLSPPNGERAGARGFYF